MLVEAAVVAGGLLGDSQARRIAAVVLGIALLAGAVVAVGAAQPGSPHRP
ncbi:MAG TPA: hypothetical protein VJZ98_03105 [Actinomycetota bacterium]|nr:hypothetical protein [Actinomycetota bacterium]